MNTYILRTTATMKPHNRKKWWIDRNIVSEKHICANTVSAALEEWRQRVENDHYITVSDNALKTKSPMFIDTYEGTKQMGYVITGKTDFEDRDNYKWSTQYIDLWVDILTVIDTVFDEEEKQ